MPLVGEAITCEYLRGDQLQCALCPGDVLLTVVRHAIEPEVRSWWSWVQAVCSWWPWAPARVPRQLQLSWKTRTWQSLIFRADPRAPPAAHVEHIRTVVAFAATLARGGVSPAALHADVSRATMMEAMGDAVVPCGSFPAAPRSANR